MERECNKCVHRKENGCEKWDCEFEPYALTREEALAILNTYDMSDDNEDVEFKSALALAIKALKKEPCEDAISRQAVMTVAKDWWGNGVMAIDDIYKLPPVEPTREWIPVSERLPEVGERLLVTQKVRDSAIVYGTTFPFEKAKEKYITAGMPKPDPYKAERGE